jgi:hypothetical protein
MSNKIPPSVLSIRFCLSLGSQLHSLQCCQNGVMLLRAILNDLIYTYLLSKPPLSKVRGS